jgi:hypothetical protein
LSKVQQQQEQEQEQILKRNFGVNLITLFCSLDRFNKIKKVNLLQNGPAYKK